jgi:hypothetical protein
MDDQERAASVDDQHVAALGHGTSRQVTPDGVRVGRSGLNPDVRPLSVVRPDPAAVHVPPLVLAEPVVGGNRRHSKDASRPLSMGASRPLSMGASRPLSMVRFLARAGPSSPCLAPLTLAWLASPGPAPLRLFATPSKPRHILGLSA